MTLEAPFHLKRRGLPGEGHQIDAPVTSRASHAFVHMNAVIEIDEVGQVIDAGPFNGFAGTPALAYGFEVRAVCPDLRVTVHARFGGRDPGISKFLDRSVAIAAIDRLVAYVMLVTELNRLFAGKEGLSVVRGAVEFEEHPDDDPNKEDRAEDGSLRDEVRASIEDLSHRFPPLKRRWKQRYQSLEYKFAVWELGGMSLTVSGQPWAALKYLTNCPVALFTIARSRQRKIAMRVSS